MSKIANKKIIKNTLFLYIRMFLVLLISLYTSREVMNLLGLEDYGIYQVIAGFVSLFIFLSFSMSTATQRFLSFEIGKGTPNKLKEIFASSFIIYCFIAFAIIFIGETLGLWFLKEKLVIPKDRLDAALWAYHFAILLITLQTIQIPFNALIIAYEQMGFYVFLSFIEVLLKLLIVFILWLGGLDKLVLYSFLMMLTAFIIAASYISFCYYRFPASRPFFFYDKGFYKEFISYSGWNLFGNIALVAKGQGINVLLNLFFGPIMNAAYGAMAQIQAAVNLFLSNLMLALSPQIIKSYSARDTPRYIYLILKGSRLSFLLMIVLIFPLIYHIDFLLSLWLKTVPPHTNDFIVLTLICLLVDSFSGTLMTGIQATGNIKWYQISVGLIQFFNLPIAYGLLWLDMPVNSVFILSILLSIVALACRIFLLRRVGFFPLSSFLREVIKPCLGISVFIPAVLYFFNYLFPAIQKGFVINFVMLILSFFICLFIAVTMGLDRTEKIYLLKYIRTKTSRLDEVTN